MTHKIPTNEGRTRELLFVLIKIVAFLFFYVFRISIVNVVSEHSQLAFDCVIIACSFESIRPGLVQGCKAPNGGG